MSSVESEAFKFWFITKHNAEQINDNFYGFKLLIDGKSVIVFLTIWDSMWSVACPILVLDSKAKKNLSEIMEAHSDQSAFGLIKFEDMLCIVNCSTNFNAADADEYVQEFATHAVSLM